MNVIRVTGRASGLLILAVTLACSKKPASLEVSPKRVVLYGIDRAQRLTARVLDKRGEALDTVRPAWASSKKEVADVDEGGRVVARGEGKATVTVTAGELTAQVPVEVIDAASIEIAPAQATLAGPPGTSYPLTAVVKSSRQQPVAIRPTWESSDPKVVSVSADGVMTSVGNGSAAVTARVGELQGAVDVSVLAGEIERIDVHPTTALVRVGDSQKFQIVAYRPDGSRIENALAGFESANPAVATIDGSGVAVGIAPGSTTIRVDLAGRTAEATLIVN
jgi:uncharacterized protein YjdB